MGMLKFVNNATTTLSGSINDTQTSISVASSGLFPVLTGTDYFYATMYEVSGSTEINVEIVKVTAVVGTTWTIVRAQDGTTARARAGITTVYIELRWTAASSTLMLQKDNDLSDLSNVATARTNLGLGTMATQSSGSVAISGGTISGVTLTSVDSLTTFKDNADATKAMLFELSGISTGTTRTLTIPNASGTIALTSDLTSGYQPLDSDLTALAALAANGLIARTGTGTVSVRTIGVPATGLTITNGDGVSGNPTLALANDLAAVEALATTGFVRRTGVDTWSASAIVDGDLPSALTSKTYNGLTLTSNATGFSVAGGTTSKTLTINNSITLAGTDATTITLPSTTGTVALNNQTMYIGTTAVAINRASASIALTGITSIDGSAASATTATTATKSTNLVGGNNTTLLGAIGYQSNTDTTTLLSPNVTTTKLFLSQTGTGTNGAAPAWGSVSKSDVGLGNVENTALSTWTGVNTIATVGTIGTGTWHGTAVGISYGGTGATTKAAGFNALSPVTTLGDLIYGDSANSNTRLAGNTTTTKKFLRQTGTGTVSAAPAWDTLVDGDIPAALTGKTYNALTLTSAATGFTIAGGTTSKTLTVSNTLTLAGTDASTLNIGSGGTLGSAAFTASTAYAPAAGSTSIVTVGTITAGTWTGSAVGISYGGTGATTKTAGFNALSPVTTLGDLIYGDGANSNTRLAGNTTTTKQFLTQTGTGTVSAAPAWGALANGDIPSALTGKTYNGLTLTANATGFQIAGGTTAKTFVVSNNLTLSGTDGSTLNIGGGGTLGTGAYATIANYAPLASPSFTGTATFAKITSPVIANEGVANEGGQITLEKPVSGTSLGANLIVDYNSTSIRFFDSGTYNTVANRGAYIDLATCSGGATSKIWHSDNDGASSGLDADLLDGQHGSYYAPIASPTFTGTVTTPNLAFNTAAGRITGDFSNATIANRVTFQTSTVNVDSAVGVIPNGTGTSARFNAYNVSTPDNSSYMSMSVDANYGYIYCGKLGTGTYLPMTFYTGGAERMQINTGGGVGIGGTNNNALGRFEVLGTGYQAMAVRSTDASGVQAIFAANSSNEARFGTVSSHPVTFYTGGSERMRIDTSGNVGIGTTSPSSLGKFVSVSSSTSLSGIVSVSSSTGATDYAKLTMYHQGNDIFELQGGAVGLKFMQSGSVERMSIASDGLVSVSARGLKLPNVADATGTTLDWYEEGTWTPVVYGSTTAGLRTYTTQWGRYTRIGNRVFGSFDLNVTMSGAAGVIILSGLPFTINSYDGLSIGYIVGLPGCTGGYGNVSGTSFTLASIASGTTSQTPVFNNTWRITGTFNYLV